MTGSPNGKKYQKKIEEGIGGHPPLEERKHKLNITKLKIDHLILIHTNIFEWKEPKICETSNKRIEENHILTQGLKYQKIRRQLNMPTNLNEITDRNVINWNIYE